MYVRPHAYFQVALLKCIVPLKTFRIEVRVFAVTIFFDGRNFRRLAPLHDEILLAVVNQVTERRIAG